MSPTVFLDGFKSSLYAFLSYFLLKRKKKERNSRSTYFCLKGPTGERGPPGPAGAIGQPGRAGVIGGAGPMGEKGEPVIT